MGAMRVALFVPCFVDQLQPRAAVAAVELLERLGVEVVIPDGAACCGQPAANAGYERDGAAALRRTIAALAPHERIVVLSGSCAMHLWAHAASSGLDGAAVGARVSEFCEFLHDDIGVDAVRAVAAEFPHRVAVHIGCPALRGLALARPSELQIAPFNKVRALMECVPGISFAELARPDECCGFGGSFSVTERAVSARMGRDRLSDYTTNGAEAVVSTDASCLLHMGGVASRAGLRLPMVHVAEVLAGSARAQIHSQWPDPSLRSE